MDGLLKKRRREFRAAGLVLFEVAAGLLISRIVANLVSDLLPSAALDALFTVMMQVVFLFIVPFVTYKLALKRSVRGVLEFCNVRKPKWQVMLLAVPLGILCLFVTMGVSTVWMGILISLGYDPGSVEPLPETFNAGMLVLDLFLTAMLPAMCEEFTNRGGVLTVFRGSFPAAGAVALCGLEFGLFHQNITQIFYTFLFGMLTAYLVLRTKSIFPGMVVHFLNNGLSVYLDYAEAYHMPLGGLIDSISDLVMRSLPLAAFLWLLCFVAGTGIVVAINYFSIKKPKSKPAEQSASPFASETNEASVGDKETDKNEAEKEESAYSAPVKSYDTEGRVGRTDDRRREKKARAERKKPSEPVPEEPDPPLENGILYRPAPSDIALYIGALVMAAFTTVITFVFGL